MAGKSTSKTEGANSAPRRMWVIDADQAPETLIERHRQRNLTSPEYCAAYARRVREKADKEGVIHVDALTGYRARFRPGEPPDESAEAA